MARGEKGSGRPFQRKGGKVWYIRYRIPGVEKEKYESSRSTNKNDAIRLLNLRRMQMDNHAIAPEGIRIHTLLELYLDWKKRKKSQVKTAEGYVKLHLEPAFGKLKAAELSTQQVTSFVTQKQAAGYKNGSINRWLSALRRAYSLARENKPAPLVTIEPPIELEDETADIRQGFVLHAQYLALRRELPKHQKLLLVMAYHWGMRLGELLQLGWHQVDWLEGVVMLEPMQAKTREPRKAPIYGDLKAWLENAWESHDPAVAEIINFHHHSVSEVKTAWKSARLRAGLPDVLFHDLRRTAVRNMVRAGLSRKRAKAISGHKTDAVFDRYDISDDRDLAEDGVKLEAYLVKQQAFVDAEIEKVRAKSEQEARMLAVVQTAKGVEIQ